MSQFLLREILSKIFQFDYIERCFIKEGFL